MAHLYSMNDSRVRRKLTYKKDKVIDGGPVQLAFDDKVSTHQTTLLTLWRHQLHDVKWPVKGLEKY